MFNARQKVGSDKARRVLVLGPILGVRLSLLSMGSQWLIWELVALRVSLPRVDQGKVSEASKSGDISRSLFTIMFSDFQCKVTKDSV